MSITKRKRASKRQLGQFLTPPGLAREIVAQFAFTRSDTVLEPSMGDGAFILPLIEQFMTLYEGTAQERLAQVLTHNVYGVEIDPALYRECLRRIEARWGKLPAEHHFINADFFRCDPRRETAGGGRPYHSEESPSAFRLQPSAFTYVLGNPPFGGTFDAEIEDDLDRIYGFRDGEKIKKETYAFFVVKSVDWLAPGGALAFICSDTLMTIRTMRGLRKFLMRHGHAETRDLEHFSDETAHPMLVLRFVKDGSAGSICVNGCELSRAQIELTANFSWRITPGHARYFGRATLGDYLIASSGMTIGRNEYFVRPIHDGAISEPYAFEFYDEPVTLAGERARARLGKLSARLVAQIAQQERAGATRRCVRAVLRAGPLTIRLPHPDYAYYNKAVNALVYAPPAHVIYWQDDGDAVLTFKKTGNWYLNGVGGRPYFLREGLTWQLIAQTLNIRYLPAGFILDSGAPCAFPRPGVARDEMLFILGWALTDTCSLLLKTVINHTKNIQGKDFERLPYPFWVSEADKRAVIAFVAEMIAQAMRGHVYARGDAALAWLEGAFAYAGGQVGG